MPDVDVFLSQSEVDRPGLARVWPPAVAVSKTDPVITFHNCTADKMEVTLKVPVVGGGQTFDVDSGTFRKATVDITQAQRGETRYSVYCTESRERARGLSHPIIIIR